MANTNLYYGGKRMGTRDIWANKGMAYWPAKEMEVGLTSADATDDFGGVSGVSSDGRGFKMDRLFRPEYLDHQEPLLTYLSSEVPTVAAGDTFTLMIIPKGTKLETLELDVRRTTTGATVTVQIKNLATGVITDFGAAVALTAGSRTLYANPVAGTDFTVNHVILVEFTAVPAGWATSVDWRSVGFELTAQGTHTRHYDEIVDTFYTPLVS